MRASKVSADLGLKHLEPTGDQTKVMASGAFSLVCSNDLSWSTYFDTVSMELHGRQMRRQLNQNSYRSCKAIDRVVSGSLVVARCHDLVFPLRDGLVMHMHLHV